jgi:hypothetical protein
MQFGAGTQNISVSGLPSGVYSLQLSTSHGMVVKKIIRR